MNNVILMGRVQAILGQAERYGLVWLSFRLFVSDGDVTDALDVQVQMTNPIAAQIEVGDIVLVTGKLTRECVIAERLALMMSEKAMETVDRVLAPSIGGEIRDIVAGMAEHPVALAEDENALAFATKQVAGESAAAAAVAKTNAARFVQVVDGQVVADNLTIGEAVGLPGVHLKVESDNG